MKDKIRHLLAQRKAVLLAHNYQPADIQDVADLCGDSLELSIRASETDAEVIVFCGVHFMAETAAILSPHKKVLLPTASAGCPMADMIDPAKLDALLARLGTLPVVTYVNSSAAIKARSTICCTSANVQQVVASLPEPEILMIPDKNLAQNTAAHSNKTIHWSDGFCPYHDRLTPQQALDMKTRHPQAQLLVHPECRPEVVALADAVLSTSGMLRHARQSQAEEFIIATEVGLIHALQLAAPTKTFYPADDGMFCVDMKKITLTDIANCLEHLTGEVRVPESIRHPADQAVRRMLNIR